MPRGDKSAYTDKQKRQAEHIEEGYEESGVSEDEAERRAWATVNAMTGGGKKSGSGRGKPVNKAPARKGGQERWKGRGQITNIEKVWNEKVEQEGWRKEAHFEKTLSETETDRSI